MFTIRGPKGVMDFSKPRIMGIVNLTPDSFYAQSRAMDIGAVVDKVGALIEDGAEIIDVGAVSTRPGSVAPSVVEELNRITGPLLAIRAAFPEIIISIDTYRSEILKSSLDAGVNLVNDISGGSMDESFLEEVGRSGLPYILMHIHGTPADMQKHPQYDDLILEQLKYFDQKIAQCKQSGIKEIIVDPGFGFGKTVKHNYQILRNLSSFRIFDNPILIGLSRKSMIYKVLNCGPSEALNGTTALHMIALIKGANILRVHDVKEARQCITLYQEFNQV